MGELQMTLSADERQCLLELLGEALKEARVEEHRTRTLSYREFVLRREQLIEQVLGKLKQPSA